MTIFTKRRLATTLLFITLAVLIEILIIYATPTAASDSTAITVPLINITISPLYHLLPAAVVITLTASFTHLATKLPILKPQTIKRPAPPTRRPKPSRLKPLRDLYRKLGRTTQRIKDRILKTPLVARIQQQISPAKNTLKNAAIVSVIFIAVTLLVTFTAYPKLLPTATANFYRWNAFFLGFVTATIQAAQTIANTITPIGAVAAAIHDALIAAAPSFRNTLQATATALTSGLVALNPTEKYLVIQNAAAWTAAIATLLYSQYAKTRRPRR